MTVLVTGATGFIGQRLVERLLKRGTVVCVLTRSPSHIPAPWQGQVEVAIGDVTEKTSLESVLERVDEVYHLAGEIRDERRYHAVNYLGTRNLLEGCVGTGVRRFLFCSSVGVIGATRPGAYTEQSACHPRTAYEKSKWLAEQTTLEFYRDGKVPVTVVRPTIVFGPRPTILDNPFLSWMQAVNRGHFRFFGSGDAAASYVYVEDVVESCIFLARDKQAVGQVYHVADPTTMEEFVGWAAQILGVPVPGHLPKWTAYALAASLEVAAKVGGFRPPLTINRVRALTSHAVFRGDKLQRCFDFPAGWRKGLQDTILAHQRTGLLS